MRNNFAKFRVYDEIKRITNKIFYVVITKGGCVKVISLFRLIITWLLNNFISLVVRKVTYVDNFNQHHFYELMQTLP
jgi:hypothetical protein